MSTEKVKDEGLTFMEEFELLDAELTPVSPVKTPSGKKKRKSSAKKKSGRPVAQKKKSARPLSKTEQALIVAGCAVAILAVALSSVLVEARRIGNAVRAFHEVGTGMENMVMIGEEGVTAMSQARHDALKKEEREKAKTLDAWLETKPYMPPR